MNNLKQRAWKTVLPWLKLYFTKGLGSLRIARLIERFCSVNAILAMSVSELQKYLPSQIACAITTIDNNQQIQQRITHTRNWLNAAEHHYLLCPDDDLYPAALKQLPDYPPVLFASGNIQLLHTPRLAIVGSRRPTLHGRIMAEKIAVDLAKCGLTIVSGLAAGVDACAHSGALHATKSTIAVLGTGIDRVYPAVNRQLTYQIEKQGLLISELPLGTSPVAGNFPKRNRIISGLSLGVLVVEATEKSGSLITARLALEQGREVFAMPGAANNIQAKGCHRLIRDGAALICEASHIMQELKPFIKQWLDEEENKNVQSVLDKPVTENHSQDNVIQQITCPVQRDILQVLGSESWHTDELLLHMDIVQEVLMTALTLLEINGIIVTDAYGYRRNFN